MMSLQDTLDFSIKLHEAPDKADCFHSFNNREYKNYLDNEAWYLFLKDMLDNHTEVFYEFFDGSGGELGVEKIGNKVSEIDISDIDNKTLLLSPNGDVFCIPKSGYRPPKMASYGSSSRMIYNLSKNVDGFAFEKKLPTSLGGIAHMDGYLEKEDTAIFIEAKCREPYSGGKYRIKEKYTEFYAYLNEDALVPMEINTGDIVDGYMDNVEFISGNNKLLEYFDIKQMLSHLLGVATQLLEKPTKSKIRFLYLLFNPKRIEISNERDKQKLFAIYDKVCEECCSVPFEELFYATLVYLSKDNENCCATDEEIRIMADNFEFRLCDQSTYIDNL